MIKYETIISNFDDKTTLYNWLRKVEEALKNASAINFVVNKKGNATLSFSITFADGTTLESGDIVLQQGESVDGARIASGVLQLHLTNGIWLTAGNIKPVSNFSIDASQHLIVNYQDGTSQDLGAIFNGNVNIDGELHITGNIHGDTLFLETDAYIDGTLDATKVTGDEIVEKMSGYSFHKSFTGFDCDYAGVVKTGNKITFVIAGHFNGTEGVAAYGSKNLGYFNFPSEIGNKLYPDSQGRIAYLKVVTFSSIYNNAEIAVFFSKDANYQATVAMATVPPIAQDYTGSFRIEQTFLLSDNLVS